MRSKLSPDHYLVAFLSKIQKTDGCWLWTGSRHSKGLGGRFYNGNLVVLAHVHAYLLFVGVVPDGMHVVQKCGNHLCVNPSHLVLKTEEHYTRDRLVIRLIAGIASPDSNGCMVWTRACHHKSGYGQIKSLGSMKQVSRLLYELFVAPIPDGMLVCHTCDNPPCCNLEHFFLGTALDNAVDRDSKGRLNPRYGSFNPRAKLDEMQVLKIRSDFAFGISVESLASDYFVSCGTIEHVVAGRTWRHMLS